MALLAPSMNQMRNTCSLASYRGLNTFSNILWLAVISCRILHNLLIWVAYIPITSNRMQNRRKSLRGLMGAL